MTGRPASHHKPGGGYRNPWPDSQPRGLGGFLRWTGQRLAARVRGESREGRRVEFPLSMPSFAPKPGEPDGLRVTWLGHSTVVLQLGATTVLLDPAWSERASPVSFAGPRRIVPVPIRLERLPPIDVLVHSHDHYDHLDAATVRALARAHPGARWVAPLGVGARLTPLGVPQVAELDWWEATRAGAAEVTCTPAQHFSGRGLGDRDRTLWGGFAIAAGGWRVFYAGDSGLHPEFGEIARRLGPFDLAIVPIGAYEPRWFMRPVHMDPDDAVTAAIALDAPVTVGVHWGTFRLTDEPLDEPPTRAVQAWAARGAPGRELWILRHGETRVVPVRRGAGG
ncbi:MAG TPA: MBL fold metallo-hydrolase [Gemmatimonadaceae bacterium]|nr:MBL fold metallo-hydrolase [Gemmatimonadaceae bacterium]